MDLEPPFLDLTPPEAVARAAAQGLAWRERFGRGGTHVGAAMAQELLSRRPVPPETVRRMASYFARHAVDARGRGWGDAANPSAGWIAWHLWGGDAGRDWAAAMRAIMRGDVTSGGG